MTQLGYALSCEEHPPADLIAYARRAEEVGFEFAVISDHFHPWIDRQGHSPFVWTVLGGIAQATERLELGTGVTCPLIRTHPAVIAQAAATCGDLLPGRFFLGVGTGENLNEHVVGAKWPEVDVRLEMLEEAVEVIRTLWQGHLTSHHGKYYTVENARIYTLPDRLPPIHMAGAGGKAAELAARIGDGYVGVAPDAETLATFSKAGGEGKPRYGQMTVCWAEDEATARQTAVEWWPNLVIPGQLGQELPLPSHFEQAASLVSEDDMAEKIAVGPDPERHLASIRQYVDAGYDHVYVHQVGPDQEGFFRFYEREVLPKLG
jgi:coenzyme F420-dependent glucose-6-phosphate dehydrogenase